ncbi:hypothetical protein C4K04_3392 [Pseudomonas chlororaphis]|uniref:Uncharacterized protein n=1 Tax=Pseudomonas chlororaphis TaxID=587753 RepID=A0A3G7TPL8_9PSED|nr:hypothetical protein C4K04_3392 [Pseudomonas chlororaphis]
MLTLLIFPWRSKAPRSICKCSASSAAKPSTNPSAFIELVSARPDQPVDGRGFPARRGQRNVFVQLTQKRSVLKDTQCQKTSNFPRAGLLKPGSLSSSRPPVCRSLSWVSIAGEKAFTLNRSVPGVRRVLLASKRSTASKRAKTEGYLSENCAAKTRRWPKRPRCCAAKKAQRLLGDRQRGQLTSLPERQLLVA